MTREKAEHTVTPEWPPTTDFGGLGEIADSL